MTSTGRQKLLLALLAVAALVFGWNRLGPWLTSDAGAGGPGGSGVGAAAGGPVSVVDLDLDRLAHEPGSFSPGRDPFRYYTPPPTPPPGPTPEELAAAEAERRRAAEAAAAAAAAAAVAERDAPPKPPDFSLTYLGSFGPKDRRIAVFSNGDAVYNALVGDVLDRQFIVAHIGYESVDIKYVDFPDLPAKRLPVGG